TAGYPLKWSVPPPLSTTLSTAVYGAIVPGMVVRISAGSAAAAGGAVGPSASVLLLDPVRQFRHLVVGGPALGHELGDFAVGVHDGGVVPVAEDLADLRQREFGQLAAQVHG